MPGSVTENAENAHQCQLRTAAERLDGGRSGAGEQKASLVRCQ